MTTAKSPTKSSGGLKPQVIDRRISDRLIARGTLTKAEFEDHLKKLTDVEDNADNIASKIFGDKQ